MEWRDPAPTEYGKEYYLASTTLRVPTLKITEVVALMSALIGLKASMFFGHGHRKTATPITFQ
jgi:hypothetical protein